MKILSLAAASLTISLSAYGQTTAPAPRAVQCVSVFEIMDRAAPSWSAQTEVQRARLTWRSSATHLAQRTGVDYGTQVNREMTRLADLSAKRPNILSGLALECLAEADTF
ncbi:MAG: hypothetical protein AAGH90_03170 [Pseudomonadota bacterium]